MFYYRFHQLVLPETFLPSTTRFQFSSGVSSAFMGFNENLIPPLAFVFKGNIFCFASCVSRKTLYYPLTAPISFWWQQNSFHLNFTIWNTWILNCPSYSYKNHVHRHSFSPDLCYMFKDLKLLFSVYITTNHSVLSTTQQINRWYVLTFFIIHLGADGFTTLI